MADLVDDKLAKAKARIIDLSAQLESLQLAAEYATGFVNARGAVPIVRLYDISNNVREVALHGIHHGAAMALAAAQWFHSSFLQIHSFLMAGEGLTIPLTLHLLRWLHRRVLPTHMMVMMPSASSENGGRLRTAIPRSNQLVTLPPGLYKAGREPLQIHAISYDSQYNPTDHRSRVLRHTDSLNLSNSCVSVAFLFSITRLSVDQSTFVGYPSEDYRRYSIDAYDEANQDVLEHSSGLLTATPDNENETLGPPSVPCLTAGLETATPDNENETLGLPSEWMEETLINLYLSGYSNSEVNAESSLGNTHTNEEGGIETTGSKLDSLTSDSASVSLNDATSKQIEVETETKNSSDVHESLGEEEEKWLAQYGQVERLNDDQPLPPTIDIWDWDVVQDHVSKGQPVVRLVGCLSRGSSKLHPSLPARGGLLRTAPVREVHLDLVRVSTAANTMEQKTKAYRDRATERRILHRGLGVGPGQKQSNTNNFDEYEEPIEDMDSMGTVSVDLNFRSSGLLSAKRIMENMGWKEACDCHSVYRLCFVCIGLSNLNSYGEIDTSSTRATYIACRRGPWKKQKGYCRTYTAYHQQTWCRFGMESNPLRCSFEDSSLCFVSSGVYLQQSLPEHLCLLS
ncbi:uncharacterized protein [Miscanthus floridulus]|uniref:uncharacterized protein n=1 Tax=Miscanthus floridulus TaxID=154761 RepID=UPI00345AC391